MRSLFYLFSALVVIGLAYWAYKENYRTQNAQNQAEKLEYEIVRARERLRILNAEWAYLNRPDRLRDLAEINYERLQLLPFQPYQFGRVDQVEYPPVDAIPFVNSIDISSQEPAQ